MLHIDQELLSTIKFLEQGQESEKCHRLRENWYSGITRDESYSVILQFQI